MEKMFEIPVGMSAMECFHAKMLESLFGFFKEWHDQFTYGEFSYADIFFDLVGCVLGLLVTIV